MTLFTSIIPLEFSFRVLGNFFKFGWVFFYKLCLEFIKRLEKKLLLCFNYAGILSTLKPDGHSVKDWKMFMKTMVKGRENINFKKIVNEAQSLEINERFLNCMLHNAMACMINSNCPGSTLFLTTGNLLLKTMFSDSEQSRLTSMA